MTTVRERRIAESVQAALRRAAERAEGYDNGPPRRRRNGHSPDCPDWADRSAFRCPSCVGERNGTPPSRPAPRESRIAIHAPGQVAVCPACLSEIAQTPAGPCCRCIPEETAHAHA